MGEKYIVALDQGTTSCRAIIFNQWGRAVVQEGKEFRQIYPKPGWVEHDPMEIWDCQLAVLKGAIKKGGISVDDIAAIGITNQRETAVVWDRKTANRSGTP